MGEETFLDRLMFILEQKNGVAVKDICSHKPTTDATWSRIIATKQLLAYGYDKSQIAKRLNITYNSVSKYSENYDNLFIINAAFNEIATNVELEIKK